MSEEPSYTICVIASAKQQPELKRKILSSKQKRLNNFLVGAKGERKAVEFLLQKGYQILQTNTSFSRFEVDIIAYDVVHGEFVFFEVKTRKSSQVHPSLAVSNQKLAFIHKVARAFVRKHKLAQAYRFDIITICKNNIEHFANVTWI